MLKQLIEENRFKIQEGNANLITNLVNEITNTYTVTNLEKCHFNNGRLTIEKNYNQYISLGNSNEKYAIVTILSNNIFNISFETETNANSIKLDTSSFTYRNNRNKINNITIAANPSYDIELYYLLISNYHNTLVESL